MLQTDTNEMSNKQNVETLSIGFTEVNLFLSFIFS
jgi:hypothetical protein